MGKGLGSECFPKYQISNNLAIISKNFITAHSMVVRNSLDKIG